ncbi:MAG: adenylate/guanylate cyclase domain-containing protein [Chloroflexi bacterium]|nr:adenylate/guanylate cyclase domain-containing protein [Chloroflexota bacterium]
MAEVAFARSGDVHIAYRVVGDGPIDLVFVQGSSTHLDVYWDQPSFRHYCERLAEFSRLILFDKRGMGMSERVPETVPLDVRMDDIRAVMDAVDSTSAAVMGESEGGPLAMLFAAAHPERTRALILQGAEVRERRDADWPWGEATVEEHEAAIALIPTRWGQGESIKAIAPSTLRDPSFPAIQAWWGKVQRNSGTPASLEAFSRMAFEIDVRSVVPSIRVPALVMHAAGDQVCHVEQGRWLAQYLPGAKYVERPTDDHVAWFEPEPVLAEIREFLTGSREAEAPDRVLVTVLFTDIVASTERATHMGDARWRALLDAHNAAVRAELTRFRGREIDTAGDGFLAAFDSPARAIRAAKAIGESVRRLGLEVRAGVHTGEVDVLPNGDLAGISVHVGARVAALARPGEVLVSSSVRDLVAGSGFEFINRGMHSLKGVEEDRLLFAVA